MNYLEDEIVDKINSILRSDCEIVKIVESMVAGKVDSFNATVDIVKRVSYVYHFQPVPHAENVEQSIAKLSHYFVMGAQEVIIEQKHREIKLLNKTVIVLFIALIILVGLFTGMLG